MAADYVFLIGPRACGKTTVGAALRQMLAGWSLVDLDHEFRTRYLRKGGPMLMVHPQTYYEGSREILKSMLSRTRVILALGGGTLINPAASGGREDVVLDCKVRGPLVLILPSRIDSVAKSILYKREAAREYEVTRSLRKELKTLTYSNYDQRVGFFRANADLVVYGKSPDKLAKRIAGHFHLSPEAGNGEDRHHR